METVNHEYYVSLEVAKLLKEAGFKWSIRAAYMDGELVFQENSLCDNFNGKQYENGTRHEFFSSPTLDVAQRWLREVKGFMVETTFITDEYSVLYQANLYEVVSEKCTGRVSELISVVKGQSEFKRTYEKAQEAGIQNALEIILEKGE